MSRRVVLVFALALSSLAGCASTAQPRPDTAEYVLAYLKTGPRAAEKSKEESQTIFAGHMANMQRLAEQRKLVIAGPFDHPNDPSWRGIFVLDVPTLDEAQRLVDSDPGVEAQVFVAELHPLRASPVLRTTLDLERESKKTAAGADPATPAGMNIRRYVMITAQDAARADRALAPLEKQGRVLWSGHFGGARTGQGVFVLDAEKIEEVDAMLGEARADLGECSIDSWWSSRSLVGLAKVAAAER